MRTHDHRLLKVSICVCAKAVSAPYQVFGSKALESEFGSSLLGLLVMQDIQLGLLMALMPFFSAGHTHHTKTTFITGFLQFVFGFCLLVVVAQLMASKLLDKFYRYD